MANVPQYGRSSKGFVVQDKETGEFLGETGTTDWGPSWSFYSDPADATVFPTMSAAKRQLRDYTERSKLNMFKIWPVEEEYSWKASWVMDLKGEYDGVFDL